MTPSSPRGRASLIRTSLVRTALAGAALLAPALALAAPAFGPWLLTETIGFTQNVESAWGPAQRNGWVALPRDIVSVPAGTVRHPLCMMDPAKGSAAVEGWLGIGVMTGYPGDIRLRCVSHGRPGSTRLHHTDGATIFKSRPGRPEPKWWGTSAAVPEPFGAIRLLTQETSGRPLYACTFPHEGRPAVGHIGDDGKCYGATASGPAVATTYQVLVTDTSPGAVAPRYGWVSGGVGYVPHGTLAKAIQAPIISAGRPIVRTDPKTRVVCRVKDANVWWPGYVSPYEGCDYFTYVGGATQRKNSKAFEVFRIGPGQLQADYVFGTQGGASFRSCVAFKAGIPDSTVWGFSSTLTGCTDGSHTSNVALDFLDLPRVNADRG